MKTVDLFESFRTNRNSSFLQNKDENIGKGFFSKVFTSKEPDQTVIKRVKDHLYDEGFDYWVRIIMKNKLRQKNPTFPRFFNIKTRYNFIVGAEMEKLVPISLLTDNQKEQLSLYLTSSSS